MSYRLLGAPLLLGILLFVAVYTLVHRYHQPVESVVEPESVVPEQTYTLEEKVGRLFMVGHWATTPVASTTALIETYHLGGVIIMSAPEDPQEISEWTTAWQQAADYPLTIAVDQEGGSVQRLRGTDFINTAQPTITTPEEALQVGLMRGEELAALGINTNFAPVVEASVLPRGFLYARTFRDPTMIPTLAEAMLTGFRQAGITGVVKHYPGHEDEPTDSHYDLPIVELANTTFKEHTRPFAELMRLTEVPILMTAHVLVPSIDPTYPATLSKKILTDELREKQDYSGIIVTDDMTMDAIDTRFTTNEATVLALAAGADLILFAAEPEKAPVAIDHVRNEVLAGTLPKPLITEHFDRLQQLHTN